MAASVPAPTRTPIPPSHPAFTPASIEKSIEAARQTGTYRSRHHQGSTRTAPAAIQAPELLPARTPGTNPAEAAQDQTAEWVQEASELAQEAQGWAQKAQGRARKAQGWVREATEVGAESLEWVQEAPEWLPDQAPESPDQAPEWARGQTPEWAQAPEWIQTPEWVQNQDREWVRVKARRPVRRHAPQPAEAIPRPAMFQPTITPRRRPVRLTRRGRVVVGALLVLAALGLLALLAPPTDAALPSGPPRTVTVHDGDTLFSIASRAAPGSSPYAAMVAIQQLNHMSDTTVFVGEQLLLPPS